jgi:RND superfamily putative drug exporter
MVWVVAAAALVAFAPTLEDITTTDQTAFIPDKYESARATAIAEDAFPQSNDASAIVVVKRADGEELTESDIASVTVAAGVVQSLGIPEVVSVTTSPQSVSEDGKIQIMQVAFEGTAEDPAVQDAVPQLREAVETATTGTDLRAGVTGEAAISVDAIDKYMNAERIVGIATIGLIIVLMLAMFRSPVAAILPIATVALVMVVSNALIAISGTVFDFQIGQTLPILLTVVLYGIGTDYILFLLFRYRERLRRGDESKTAVRTSVTRVGEAIASAASAVIVAFSALWLSSFEMFQTMGPGLAIAVATMLVAALTLIPAVVSLVGPRVFWPSKSWQSEPEGSLSRWAGGLVARRPLAIVVAGVVLLLTLVTGATQLKQDYESMGSPLPGTESATWYDEMTEAFPAGTTTPTFVFVKSDSGPLDPAAMNEFATDLAKVDGVGEVRPVGQDEAGNPVLWAPAEDGRTGMVTVLLDENPYSAAARENVGDSVRPWAHRLAPAGTTAEVGGLTSAFVDIADVTSRDLRVIFPVAGVLILIILMVLLRALVAPVYLMLAVALGYASTLGATTYVFQNVFDQPGLMFILPIFVYLFVVAIGTDYNILMIARLREEARLGLPPRRAADMAVEHAGPSIASAGVILAGTFTALTFSGITMLTQIGFAVAVGIGFSAFLISMFIVPSITALVGHAAWWPGHGDAVTGEPEEQEERREQDDSPGSTTGPDDAGEFRG